MLKNFVWSVLHPVRFHYKIKDSWGFCSRNRVEMLEKNLKNDKNDTLKKNCDFEIGVKNGYYQIYKSFYKKENFFSHCYTTPKLSFALNELSHYSQHSCPALDFNSLNIKILSSKIEYGLVKSNDKILGFWTPQCIEHEIMIGMIGPEIQSIWNQQQKRKVVQVLYEFPNRKDVWTWQCSVHQKHYFWNVKNINQILL